VRDARLHDARHTAATLLQQGVAPRVAMQLLGHSQISMTMHYTHVVPELAKDKSRAADGEPRPVRAGQAWSRLGESNSGQPHYE